MEAIEIKNANGRIHTKAEFEAIVEAHKGNVPPKRALKVVNKKTVDNEPVGKTNELGEYA